MKKDSAKRKIAPSSIIALLLGIMFIAVGIFNIVTSRIDAKEYQNTTDIRTVEALVEKCRRNEVKDNSESRYGNNKRVLVSFDLTISFAIDGTAYTAKGTIAPGSSAFRSDIQKGDTITIEVYRTSKGQYKIPPENNPIDFLIACALIPLGAVFSLALVYDLTCKKPDKAKGRAAKR